MQGSYYDKSLHNIQIHGSLGKYYPCHNYLARNYLWYGYIANPLSPNQLQITMNACHTHNIIYVLGGKNIITPAVIKLFP